MRACDDEPIDVTAPADPNDPREPDRDVPGVRIHRTQQLHPDDVTVVDGVPVTTVSRTLVDLAELLTRDELRRAFATAKEKELLEMDAVEASYGRLEWRPSLGMLREVMDEFAA